MTEHTAGIGTRRSVLFRGASPALITGLCVFLIILAAALLVPALSSVDPNAASARQRFQPPGAEHLFGTDGFGRDFFTRVMYGARVSLSVGCSVALFSCLLGTIIGLCAAYFGFFDALLMCVCDGLTAIPGILLSIALMEIFGRSFDGRLTALPFGSFIDCLNVVAALTIVYTPSVARVVRAGALTAKEQTYVEAAIVQGAGSARILRKLILPNVLSPLTVQASFIFAQAVISEASLSFLGVGIRAPAASWGNILQAARSDLYKAPWTVIFPGTAVVLCVLSLNLIGDGLRDLLDPKHRAVSHGDAKTKNPASRFWASRLRASRITHPAGEREVGGGKNPANRQDIPKTPEHDILLEIRNLSVEFPLLKDGMMHFSSPSAKPVDGVSMTVGRGEIIGIAGESGCGKSVMTQSLLRLTDHSICVRYSGEIILNEGEYTGINLTELTLNEMRAVRGRVISAVFQDPMTSLNPVRTVGSQLCEGIRLYTPAGISRADAAARGAKLLARVGIHDPERCMRQYPFELSGGMQQRVMIAAALSSRPKLLIADEPTTALDVTLRKQILSLIAELSAELGMSVLFITHDLRSMTQICTRACVMYLGRIVEAAPISELLSRPLHPYTRGLLECIPRIDSPVGQPLRSIPGTVPPLSEAPEGCRFSPRCMCADERCRRMCPPMSEPVRGHSVACWHEGGAER